MAHRNAQPRGTTPNVQFARHEGFPEGVLVLKAGSAALNGLNFRNGTIGFDMKAIGEEIPGIQFRMQGPRFAENGEEFYVRTYPDCRASSDCIQYTPVIPCEPDGDSGRGGGFIFCCNT